MLRIVPRALCAAVLATAVVACAGGSGGPAGSPGGAGDSRYRILIPDLEGVSGDQVANVLRGQVAGMERHTAVPHGEVRRALSQYGLTELGAIEARQLAQLMNAQLVSWGSVTQSGEGLQASVTFTDVASGDNFTVEATGANARALGQAIHSELNQSIQGILLASFCNDYLSSEQFEQALTNCEQALEVIPTGTAALYGKGTALFNLDRHDEALATYRRLLEVDPNHQDGLLGAGLAASHMQRGDEALGYYRQYMELNPDDPQVRMKVAGDVAQAGDVAAAYEILQPGVASNQDDVDYQLYFAQVALQAGRVTEERDRDAARRYYEEASRAYERVIAARGDELEVGELRQIVAVYNELGRSDEALRYAQRGTQQFADDAPMWALYASVLSRAGRHSDEVQALSRVAELDADFENVFIRRAIAYQKVGNRQAALRDFERAAAGNREAVGQAILAMAAEDAQRARWADAEQLAAMAATYAGPSLRSDIAFIRGIANYRQGEAIARENTQGRAEPARRALQFFRQAVTHLQATNNQQAPTILSAAQQFIQNQEAIIEASRGR